MVRVNQLNIIEDKNLYENFRLRTVQKIKLNNTFIKKKKKEAEFGMYLFCYN